MDIREIIVNHEINVREAMKLINDTSRKILYFVDQNNVLIGVLTDGDIRRWILKNGSLQENVYTIMNHNPKGLKEDNRKQAFAFMKKHAVESVAIVDSKNNLKDIIFWHDSTNEVLQKYGQINTPVVIMAGGKGTRLIPYTNILPKPLIPIGDIPIVERIMNKFSSFGCTQFFMTVNFKKNMIKSYFSDSDCDYSITYIEEEKPLGTGGGLSLLKGKINETFFLSNSDILIDADYSDILNFHKKSKNLITIVSSMKSYIIPYGVLEIDDKGSLLSMEEKPEFHFLINTGVYVVEPEVLETIPNNKFVNFTEIIEKLKNESRRVGVFHIGENDWFDMGQIKEMENMIKHFQRSEGD